MSAEQAKVNRCEDCGIEVRKRLRADRSCLCTDCGLTHAIKAAEEMAAKSGPAWDRWLASNGPLGTRPLVPKQE